MSDRVTAQDELDAFEQENRVVADPTPLPEPIDSGWLGVLAYCLVIWGLPWLEFTQLLPWDFREVGVLDVDQVRAGEWWRTATALTLHADLGHIVANTCFGGLFGLLAGRMYGSGLAWLLILFGGILGNLLNVFVQEPGFRALGASTANFAALALVAAGAWRRRYFRGRGWRRTLTPVFGGIALLVYTGLGSEDGRTDVIGHLCGFAGGFLLGLISGTWPVAARGLALQCAAGALATGTVVACWLAAGG